VTALVPGDLVRWHWWYAHPYHTMIGLILAHDPNGMIATVLWDRPMPWSIAHGGCPVTLGRWHVHDLLLIP
jgi:hypothetical protein